MKRHPAFRWLLLVAVGVFLAGAPANAATYQCFVLSDTDSGTIGLTNGKAGLISKLVASGNGSLSPYQVLLSIQGSSNPSISGILTPGFMSTLAGLPASSNIFVAPLRDFVFISLDICTDGTVQSLNIWGGMYQGAPGTSTLRSNISGVGNAKFVSSTTPGGAVTSFIDNSGLGPTYNVIGIGFSGEQTFVLSNEGANGLISKLVAAGYGSLNLYQTLVQIAANAPWYVAEALSPLFLNTLTSNPPSSAIFTTPLSSFNVPGEAVAISTDGSAQVVNIYGQGYADLLTLPRTSGGPPAVIVNTASISGVGNVDFASPGFGGYGESYSVTSFISDGTLYNVYGIGFIPTVPAVPGTPAPPSLWLTITGCLALFGYALWSRRRVLDITSAGG